MCKNYIPYEDQLSDRRWQQKRRSILNRDNNHCRMCGVSSDYVLTLNVHHRYYIYNAKAWEYNDDCLVSLCSLCHERVHRLTTPICYYIYENSFLPMNLTPCNRCHGAGHFREYKHIENGICFRCRGKRYEELIGADGTDRIDVSNYILSDEESYDVLHPINNETELNCIFQNGLNYEKGINGVSVNIDEAYKWYRIAALNNHVIAQNICGYILANRGSFEKAARWWVYASLQGDKVALANLTNLENSNLLRAWDCRF